MALLVETNTGHLLDEYFNLAINSNQRIYTIFENINTAIDLAKSIINERNDIECNLHGREMSFLQIICR